MSKLGDIVEYYGKDAWIKNEDGGLIPAPSLLKDQGQMMRNFQHALPRKEVNHEVAQEIFNYAIVEVAEALRDLALVANMPPSEARMQKIGSLCVTLQRVEYRLREMDEK